MLFTVPEAISEIKAQVKFKNRQIKPFLFIIVVMLAVLAFYQIGVVLLLTKKNETSVLPFSGSVWKNPYNDFSAHNNVEKLALHTHTNEVWFTPERHGAIEIWNEYKRNGFSNIAITDYGQISKIIGADFIEGFEWGQNLRKRHILSIGAKRSFSDYFPVYASRENISWVIDRMRNLGGYVIIPHPKLNDAFSKNELIEIVGYNAVEVYSPFGDDSRILDILLSAGRNVHCMANDDLHYLPESTIKTLNQPFWKNWIQYLGGQRGRRGESSLRYIVTSDGIRKSDELTKSLQNGSFFCVKKFFREGEDPKIPKIEIKNNKEIIVSSSERYLEIRWIGQNGEIRKIDPDRNNSNYQIQDHDTYIRLEIIGLTGSILSNAMYRNGSKP
ncbi:phosphoesterase [Leptospira sp. 96542]|nr:phosphoesterase [Leptospira sp. 96542]